MKYDGLSSYIEGGVTEAGEEEPEMPENISIEAWISLGAYPWNWAPIITIGKYKITGFYFGIDSRGRLGFHISDATSVWHECNSEFDLEGANIQLINFKSKYKPFIIFREGGSFEVFSVEVRPDYSHFPWWNHWPVAQISSDGRSANAPDRATHSSLSWGDPGGEAALYGMAEQPEKILVDLARSWNYPPEIVMKGSDYKSKGYDYTQRAFVINTLKQGKELNLTFNASEKSHLFNPTFVFQN